MITTPNRIVSLRNAIESGEPIDYHKLNLLVALDMIIAGREFMEEAVRRNEEWDQNAAIAIGGAGADR